MTKTIWHITLMIRKNGGHRTLQAPSKKAAQEKCARVCANFPKEYVVATVPYQPVRGPLGLQLQLVEPTK